MKALIQLEIEQRLIEGASGYASRGPSSTIQRWRKIQIDLREGVNDVRRQATKCAAHVAEFIETYLKDPDSPTEPHTTAEILQKSYLDAAVIEEKLTGILSDIHDFTTDLYQEIETRNGSFQSIASEVESTIAGVIKPIPPFNDQMTALLLKSALPGLMGLMVATLPTDTVLIVDELIEGNAKHSPLTEVPENDMVEGMNYPHDSSLLKCFLGVGLNLQMDLPITRSEDREQKRKNPLAAQKRRLAIKLYTIIRESLVEFSKALAEGSADHIQVGGPKRFRRLRGMYNVMASKFVLPFRERSNRRPH